MKDRRRCVVVVVADAPPRPFPRVPFLIHSSSFSSSHYLPPRLLYKCWRVTGRRPVGSRGVPRDSYLLYLCLLFCLSFSLSLSAQLEEEEEKGEDAEEEEEEEGEEEKARAGKRML